MNITSFLATAVKLQCIKKPGRDFLTGPVAIGQGVNDFKLKEGRVRLDIRKKIFTRVVKYWNRLLREVIGVPFLETFKCRLHVVLGNLI